MRRLRLRKQTNPRNPPLGYRDIYLQPDGDVVVRESDGTESALGGSGSGGVTVDNTVDPPAAVTSIVAALATDPAGGSTTLATPTLAEVLAEGNTTGANFILAPVGVIDGRADGLYLEAGPITDPSNRGFSGFLMLSAVASGGGAQLSGGYDEAVGSAGSAYFGGPADGQATLVAGDAAAGTGHNGGDVLAYTGAGDGAGRHGLVFLNLPTSDPGVAGALWSNLGVVTVSAG